MKVTIADLERKITLLNEVTNNPEKPYIFKDDRSIAQIGNYHLAGAYGGYELQQIMNEGGGVRDVLYSGYTTKRDLYYLICAYIQGIESERD